MVMQKTLALKHILEDQFKMDLKQGLGWFYTTTIKIRIIAVGTSKVLKYVKNEVYNVPILMLLQTFLHKLLTDIEQQFKNKITSNFL